VAPISQCLLLNFLPTSSLIEEMNGLFVIDLRGCNLIANSREILVGVSFLYLIPDFFGLGHYD
jgi:hypothetical protein